MNIYQMNFVVDVFGQGQSGTPIGTVGTPVPTIMNGESDGAVFVGAIHESPEGTSGIWITGTAG